MGSGVRIRVLQAPRSQRTWASEAARELPAVDPRPPHRLIGPNVRRGNELGSEGWQPRFGEQRRDRR
jgi:hypothetical protein